MTAPKYAEDTWNGRYYFKPGHHDNGVPSITNIMKRHNKPAINKSMVTKAAHYAVDNRERLKNLTDQEQVTLIRESQYEKSKASADGDKIHAFIERRVKGDTPTHHEVEASGSSPTDHTVKWMWDSFLKWEAHYKPEYTGTEFTVWSDKYGYAGTMDLGMKIRGYHVLCDTKSGKQPYPETAMQLAAGAFADYIVTDHGQEPIPAYERFAILHVRPRGATLVPVFKVREAFQAFLALKTVFDWEVLYKDSTLGNGPKIN